LGFYHPNNQEKTKPTGRKNQRKAKEKAGETQSRVSVVGQIQAGRGFA
jgi:hypothetical protein